MSGTIAPIDLAIVAAGTGGFVINGRYGDYPFDSGSTGDRSGWSVASAGDINGDGFVDIIIGAPLAGSLGLPYSPNVPKFKAGESYVVFGKASGWGAPVDLTAVAGGTGGFIIVGQDPVDYSGWSVASAGDVNGDGFADLIIGAHGGDGPHQRNRYGTLITSGVGDSYVVFGKASGWGAPLDLATIAAGTGGFVIYGEDAGDQSGRSVASAGDINGDGFADLIIGAYGGDGPNSVGGAQNGDSYVIFGKASGWGASVSLGAIAGGTGGFVLRGRDMSDTSGWSVASAGDVNGDGFADIIIGAPKAYSASNARGQAGESYVVFGKASGWDPAISLNTIALGTGGIVINGQDGGDKSGFSVASAGDINGDGFADIIIGASSGRAAGNTKYLAGESYVVFGKASGWGAQIDLTDIAAGTGGFVLHGQDVRDRSGYSVASAGDVNGDGFDDLIIGTYGGSAAGNAKNYAGDSYVVFGKASGWGAPIDLAAIAGGTGGFVIYGRDPGDAAGRSVASAGDINGDGFADLIVGARNGDGNGRYSSDNRGESYVVFGRDFTNTVTHAGTANDEVLTGTAGANVMLGGLGNDTLNGGGGADALQGGAGDDRLEVSDFTFLRVDGGTGTDTLALTGGGLTLDLAAIADSKLQGIEAIDLGSGNALFLTALEVLNLSDTRNTLRVTGGVGSLIFLRDSGWARGTTLDGFVNISNGSAAVLVQEALLPPPPTSDNDTLIGISANDTIDGLAGDDSIFGLAGDDSLIGGTGADTLDGSLGNDTLVGYGGDVLKAGSGDDRLAITNTAFQSIEGGSGEDTLALSGEALTLDLNGIPDSKLQSIEVIDLANGSNQLRITAQEILNLSESTDTLRVTGGTSAGLVFEDAGWVEGATEGGFTIYTQGLARLELQKEIKILDPYLVRNPFVDLADIVAGIGGFVINGRRPTHPNGIIFDRFGWSVGSAGDINGDGFADLIIGAPNGNGWPTFRSLYSGESYVLFGKAFGWGTPISASVIAAGNGGFVVVGQNFDQESGASVGSAGDINGDGFTDLIIGATGGREVGSDISDGRGHTYVIFGKASAWSAPIETNAIIGGIGGFAIFGQDPGDLSGRSVASAGDVNGDGFADIIIGAISGDAADNAKRGAGESYVVFGKASGWGTPINLTNIAAGSGGFVIYGQDEFDGSGWSVASAGDINGDSFGDLIIGSPFSNIGSDKFVAGKSYVVFGKASGWGAPIDLGAVTNGAGGFVILGRNGADLSGSSVASAGDINGDGFADLIIAAPRSLVDRNIDRSESYIVFGKASGWGSPIDLADIAAGDGGFVVQGQGFNRGGEVVSSGGDINGDGVDDLIIAGSDRTFVMFGKPSGWGMPVDLATVAQGDGGLVISFQSGWSSAPASASSVGDVNGDGFDDLVIGNSWAERGKNQNESAGDSYVIFGRDFMFSVTHVGTASSEALTGTASADVMVGGLGNDTLLGQGSADALQGGAGDDRLVVSDFTFLRGDGGTGTDTLALSGSSLTLNLASIADTKLQSIEAIDLGSGRNMLRLTALEVLNLSESSNTLRITGGMGSGLTFDDSGWVQGGTTNGYVTFTNGAATVHVAGWIASPSPSPTTGNDSVMGSMESDELQGLAGNDTLSGGAGDDTLGGGEGNDLFFVTEAGDVVIELAGGGADTMIASVSMTMPDQVEVLQIASDVSGITITGGAGNDMLIGNGLANTFVGGAGDDVILAGNVTLADIYALFTI